MVTAPAHELAHYRAVASVYQAAQRASNPAPGRAVAVAFGVSQPTASVWTRKARALGYITTPAPYRTGGSSSSPSSPSSPPPPLPPTPPDPPREAPLEATTDVRIATAGPDEAFGGPGELAQDLASLRRLAARVGRVVDAETSADRLVGGARVLAVLTSQIRAAERAVMEQNRIQEVRDMARMAAEKAEKDRMEALNDEFAQLANGRWVDDS